MHHVFTLVLLLFTLTSCYGPQLFIPQPPIVRDYDSDAFTSVAEHQANRLGHRWRWYLEDAWVYYDDERDNGAVHHIWLKYRSQNILELQDARAKLVDFVEEFLEKLRTNPETAANLVPGFSADNLRIHVDFQTYWGMYGDPMYVGWMVLECGMVYYYNFDVKLRLEDYWYDRVESYNKSKEIVRLERESELDYQNSLPKGAKPDY